MTTTTEQDVIDLLLAQHNQIKTMFAGRRMAGAVRAAEAISPTRPHPGAGESATANMLAGPPVAVFDKIRDAVRDWRQSNKG
ncbi:hypothetical protein AB0O28_21325 [Microbispora sp. NPDC088329]|uniref:hypothetical protein n=1 Tax=Microbispora sp. NPDC088329 TaxID=3154869 RepID=UPI0034463231